MDCPGDVDLLELGEVFGEEAGDEEGLVDESCEGFENDEIVALE